tara:strand:+ start:106 stop:270 length:165 start_codon:yes stop_codon:yes gene_type:complete
MCPNCQTKTKHLLLDGMLCNECWDISFDTPIDENVNWSFNKRGNNNVKETMDNN